MRNISFDNPWWLLLAPVLLAAVIVPYVVAIGRDNKSKATLTSLILHIVIVCMITLSIAGTTLTAVMTRTEVYFVADVSYSSTKNLDLIDEHIASVRKNLPRNSKVGVVCFGKDAEVTTQMGKRVTSVKNAKVENGATDIVSALNYTAGLFQKDTIKRIVLITDGRATSPDATAELVRTMDQLYSQGIYIDAIFLDNNIKTGEKEVQLSGVDYAASTYLNHKVQANVMVQAGTEMKGKLILYRNGAEIASRPETFTSGFSFFSFDLDTSEAGVFDYEVKVEADGDISSFNNSYRFTQSVAGELNVLLVTSKQEDVTNAQRLYGEYASIDAYVQTPDVQLEVPCTIEQMSKYDEIMISGVDVRELRNYTAFINAVDQAVSVFGKSLMTMGDLKIQNKSDEVLKELEDMLPVKMGNSAQDAKLFAIVIDTSRSMQLASRLIMAKQVATKLVNVLQPDDQVMVLAFSGDPKLVVTLQDAENHNQIAQVIDSLEPTQGTVLGAAMEQVYEMIKDMPHENKQVMVISDGMSYGLGSDQPVKTAAKMYADGIQISTVNTGNKVEIGINTLKDMAAAAGGEYYYLERVEQVDQVVFGEIGDNLTETVVNQDTKVTIKEPKDPVLENVSALPNIGGFVHSKAKGSANTVLAVPYQKENGGVVDVPLYAYWNYGNGKVATFTSSMLGDWTQSWVGQSGETFFSNLLSTNTPGNRVDYPYTLNVDFDGIQSLLEVIPATINPFVSIDVTITAPSGTVTTKTLTFDQTRYFYSFATPEVGKYTIDVSYSNNGEEFQSSSVFNISYSPEYNCFANCSAATLNTAMGGRGVVSEDGNLKLVNDEREVATYTIDFAMPMLIFAIILFILDIIIRKLKWADIRSLFKPTKIKGV